jgi:hypothetical protein
MAINGRVVSRKHTRRDLNVRRWRSQSGRRCMERNDGLAEKHQTTTHAANVTPMSERAFESVRDKVDDHIDTKDTVSILFRQVHRVTREPKWKW